jgi:uncharacterized protein (TIGR02246 family)
MTMLTSVLLAAAVATAQPDCAALLRSAHPTIAAANADWVRAMKAADVDAIVDAYAEDALFVLADGTPVRGRAAIRDLYAGRAKAASGIEGGWIKSLGTSCAGDGLVVEWGRAALTVRSAGGRTTERGGAYLTVWKELGGAWKIVRNLTF